MIYEGSLFIDLTLINRKDKPVIIFDVYVKIRLPS